MAIKNFELRQIGVIYTPFNSPEGVPIQPLGAEGIDGRVEVFPEFIEGLKDIEGFSHIILIYYFHFIKGSKLIVKPFMDNDYHGVFATRASSRPNPIGLSIVRLIDVKDNIIHIRDIDIVNKTPLLDIKPYVPEFDIREVEKIGWLEKNIHKLPDARDDGRFIE